jgi:hypothetical protein
MEHHLNARHVSIWSKLVFEVEDLEQRRRGLSPSRTPAHLAKASRHASRRISVNGDGPSTARLSEEQTPLLIPVRFPSELVPPGADSCHESPRMDSPVFRGEAHKNRHCQQFRIDSKMISIPCVRTTRLRFCATKATTRCRAVATRSGTKAGSLRPVGLSPAAEAVIHVACDGGLSPYIMHQF